MLNRIAPKTARTASLAIVTFFATCLIGIAAQTASAATFTVDRLAQRILDCFRNNKNMKQRLMTILMMLGVSICFAAFGVQNVAAQRTGQDTTYNVTQTGSYTIIVRGADGGFDGHHGYAGGSGATLTATFALQSGDELTLVTGPLKDTLFSRSPTYAVRHTSTNKRERAPQPNSRKYSTTVESSGTAQPARWHISSWRARTRYRRGQTMVYLPMLPAAGPSPRTKIFSPCGRTLIPMFRS